MKLKQLLYLSVQCIYQFSLLEHPNSSPLFSAFIRVSTEEFKQLDKYYLTKISTTPGERKKDTHSIFVTQVRKWMHRRIGWV